MGRPLQIAELASSLCQTQMVKIPTSKVSSGDRVVEGSQSTMSTFELKAREPHSFCFSSHGFIFFSIGCFCDMWAKRSFWLDLFVLESQVKSAAISYMLEAQEMCAAKLAPHSVPRRQQVGH